jgi:hypothetical protein
VREDLLSHPFLIFFPIVVVASPLNSREVHSQTAWWGIFPFLEHVVGAKVFGVANETMQTICEGAKGKLCEIPFRIIDHANLCLNEGKEIMVRAVARKGEKTESEIFQWEDNAAFGQMNDKFLEPPPESSNGFRLLLTSVGPPFFPRPEPFGASGTISRYNQLEEFTPLLFLQKIMAMTTNDELALHLIGAVVAAEE